MDETDDEYDADAAAEAREGRINDAEDTQRAARTHDEFVYVKTTNDYRDLVDLTSLVDRAVDSLIPVWRTIEGDPPRRVRPSFDIRGNPESVMDGITWWPGMPRVIHDQYLSSKGGIVSEKGWRYLNEYVPPKQEIGNSENAKPWIELVTKLIPVDREREAFLDYCAAMIQFPGLKTNSGVLLAGPPGIGKDSILTPLRMAVGPHNSDIIDPEEVFNHFNPWAQNVMLTINEMEPGSEHSAWEMIKRLKRYTAAPPLGLTLDNKNEKRKVVLNVVRVFAMTNDIDSIYMEQDQRRWLVLDMRHVPAKWHKESDPEYFIRYIEWNDAGGWRDVAQFLKERDISHYNMGEPLVETAASLAMVEMSNAAPDDAFAEAITKLENPDVVFGFEIKQMVQDNPDFKREIEALFKSVRNLTRRAAKNKYRLVYAPHTDDDKKSGKDIRFQFKAPGMTTTLKARMALVKAHIPDAESMVRIMERGKAIAGGKPLTSPAPTDSGPQKVVPIRPDKF